MPVFAVEYTYRPDPDALDEVRPRHRAFLRELFEQDSLLASGPYQDGQGPDALLLVVADDEKDALDLLEDDPFNEADLISDRVARPWNPVIGPWELG